MQTVRLWIGPGRGRNRVERAGLGWVTDAINCHRPFLGWGIKAGVPHG